VIVMVYHFDRSNLLPGGYVGVDVFFVLSGFLITSLLMGEWGKNGSRVSFGYFYARRALRLLPALLLVLILAAVAVETIGGLSSQEHVTLIGIPFVILYVANWSRAVGHDNALGLLGHTWSLAVEEQFYLIWPVAFALFMPRVRSRMKVAWVLGGLVVAEWVYRLALLGAGVSVNRISNGTDTHCDGLLLGCAIAFWLASRTARSPKIRPSWTHAAALVGAVVIAGCVLFGNITPSGHRIMLGYTLVPVATAAILVDQLLVPLGAFRAVLTWAPVRWIGRRSYGLYLWHYPIYIIFGTINFTGGHAEGIRDLTELVTSFVVATLSWWLVEERANRYRHRFQVTEALPRATYENAPLATEMPRG
jgi:peptidoglycan/LPS O-acetylase OafA/YrhL